MNIVILDAVTISEDQLNRLETLGTVTQYTTTSKNNDEIIDRVGKAEVLITGWTTFDAQVLESLQKVKIISLWSTGYDQIDLECARKQNIVVTNVRGYAKNAVAELSVGLMLDVFRKISLADTDVKVHNRYGWQPFLGRELTHKTVGIIGFGAIGKKVARIATGFDMKVLVHTTSKRCDDVSKITYVSKETLLQESDIVTLHLPLTDKTKHYITKEEFSLMKNSAILINTARGGLVDQQALVEALSTGGIEGAGLDDIELGHPSTEGLKTLDNVVLTPHIGFNTREALIVKTDGCIDNVVAFINGKQLNVLT